MCLYPKLIINPKYKANKKNRGIIPPVKDERIKYVPIGCGNCIECVKKKQREWQVRLTEEIRNAKTGENIFVTLTFSDQSYTNLRNEIINKEKKEIEKQGRIYEETKGYELDNKIATLATRRFLERYRKKYKKSVKHWFITEIGGNGTENIHIHGIIFKYITKKELEEIWKYGIADNGKYVNEETINYITKYASKKDSKHKTYKPIILTSAGIGNKYTERQDSKLNSYKQNKTKETYTDRNGRQRALPIYYRNKIYNESEREKLWLEKLDKEERYVCGEKISIKTETGIKEYEKTREYYRKQNIKLGYGTDENENKEYEMQNRIIKQLTRIKKGSVPRGTIGGLTTE